jgi:hypothetical protein
MRRWVIVGIAFFFGWTMVIQFLLSEQTKFGQWAKTYYEWMNVWSIIIAGMTLILAVGSMTRMHFQRIQKQEPGWFYSAITLAALYASSVVGIIWTTEQPKSPAKWLFDFVNTPLDGTMFALLAFFIASASYRAFRARNVEATLMLATAIIVMLGRVTIGAYISPYIPAFADWLFFQPNLAAQRGLMIGIALGATVTAIKIIFGIERPYLVGGGK